MTPRLSRGAIKVIEAKIDGMYDRLLNRLLGTCSPHKSLFMSVDPFFSVPGLYAQAVSEEGGAVDRDLVQGLSDVVSHITDKQRSESKAITIRKIQAILEDVKAGRIEPQNFKNHLESELIDTWGRVSSNVERIVDTETQHAMTIGLREGISQINAVRGIVDPVLVFVVKNDQALCDECRRVHLLDDGHTPRAWYQSEVSADYHHRGDNVPSFHLMHPHCRCVMGTILPGFGLDGNGRITFIADGFSELDFQRTTGGGGGVEARRRWRG